MRDKIRTYDDFLALFPAQPRKKSGNGWKVLCPAHDDRDPSLCITPSKSADFIADFTCFGGCDRKTILNKMNLTWSDLQGNGHELQTKQRKVLVGSFNYTDEHGNEVYQIRRYEPKSFAVFHLENGEYILGLGAQKPILYHLPELIEWIQQSKIIYVPEGEGKVDLLIAMGLASTTAPFGANAEWHSAFNEYLIGADVVILPDNDGPGLLCAQIRANSLVKVVKSLKVLQLPNLPPKGDIKDWVNIGGIPSELEALTAACPEYQSTPAKKISNPNFGDAIEKGDVHLKRYSGDPPRYELYWSAIGKDTPISLNGDDFCSWATVWKAIFRVWKTVISDDMKPSNWHKLMSILNDNCEDINEHGASLGDEVLDILENWTRTSGSRKWSAGDINGKPIYKDGFYYFKMNAFEKGALFTQNSRFYYRRYDIPRGEVFKILKNAGAATLVKRFKGHKDGIWVWRIHEDFNKPTEQAQGELTPDDEPDAETTPMEKNDDANFEF